MERCSGDFKANSRNDEDKGDRQTERLTCVSLDDPSGDRAQFGLSAREAVEKGYAVKEDGCGGSTNQ